jgi:hypothetical protein
MNRWYLHFFAIAVLPLLGFWLERGLSEPFAGPALYALYAVGLVTFALILTGRLVPSALSVAAGVLGIGSVFAGAMAIIGTAVATITLAMLSASAFSGPPRSAYDHVRGIAGAVTIATIMVSPWLTSVSLGQLALRSIRSSRERIGALMTVVGAILGIVVTAVAMALTVRADAAWLAPRLQVFDTDNVASWEQSLSDIKGRWLCGHRRCLMPVCGKLMARFGRTSGTAGPFVSPFGFVLEAPDVPQALALPFVKIYGHPVTHVCAIGD